MASTMKDISKYTGLGLATVSSYFNGGHLREKNRILVEKAIVELNFELNETARSLRTKKSKTIGILIPELNNIFCATIISLIEDILRGAGYATIICDCRSDRLLEKELVDFLIKKKVDGIINMPVCTTGENLNRCVELDIPLVLIDRKLKSINADCVIVDNINASHNAVKLLIDNGHRKIGFVCGDKDVFTAQQRLAGYVDCLRKNNVDFSDDLVAYGDYSVESGINCIKELISKNPEMTAIFVSNYEMTLGALIALNELNIKIPQDISIIGFDNYELARVTTPRLYIVSQPLGEIAKNAAELLLNRLSGTDGESKTIMLDTEIITGKSISRICD